MGVDVGTKLHVVIREWVEREMEAVARLWFAGTVDSFEDLPVLIKRFNVRMCVIDNQPEQHSVERFARACRPRVMSAYYSRTEHGHERSDGEYYDVVHANRTQAIDEVVDRFRQNAVALPTDARQLGGRVREGMGEYYRELLALKRVLEEDVHRNPRANSVNNGKADHYAHAEVYCGLAQDLAPGPARVRWI